MKTCAQFNESREATAGGNGAAGGAVDSRNHFQHGGLATAVMADQAVHTAFGNLQVHMLQGPEILAALWLFRESNAL